MPRQALGQQQQQCQVFQVQSGLLKQLYGYLVVATARGFHCNPQALQWIQRCDSAFTAKNADRLSVSVGQSFNPAAIAFVTSCAEIAKTALHQNEVRPSGHAAQALNIFLQTFRDLNIQLNPLACKYFSIALRHVVSGTTFTGAGDA